MNFLSLLVILGFLLLVFLALWNVIVIPKKRSEILWKRLIRKYHLTLVGEVYTGVIQERRITLQKNPFSIETIPIAPKGLRVVIHKSILLPAGGLASIVITSLPATHIKSNKIDMTKKLFNQQIISLLQQLPVFAITIDGSITIETRSNSPEEAEEYIALCVLLAKQLESL